MTHTNAVGWFDIFVNEMDRAEGFYKAVLGAEMEDMHDPTGETEMKSFVGNMEVYGAAGALVKAPHAKPGPGGTQIYFSVEDCATQQARAVAVQRDNVVLEARRSEAEQAAAPCKITLP